MNQQKSRKPEENQNNSAELSDKDLEEVVGGLLATTVEFPNLKTAKEASSDLNAIGSTHPDGSPFSHF